MKKLVLIALTVAGLSASAEVTEDINCGFTEPFISYNYLAAEKAIVLIGPREDGGPGMVELDRWENATIVQIENAPLWSHHNADWVRGTWAMKDANNNTIVKFALDFEGSDGMSDMQYPFTGVVDNGRPAGYSLVGGCYSESLPIVDPYEKMQDMGLPLDF